MASVLKVDAAELRRLFPRAPQTYLDGLLAHWDWIDRAGITASRKRFAYCMANVEHECGGFTIPRLTENINYTHARAAQVWPNRFPGGSGAVMAKYGAEPGWQLKMFDDVYGNRMGNRPGTRDGSRYIGRGAPQITGRDGYAEIERRTGLPLVANPELAADPNNQAQIIAAFWSWKGLNSFADNGDWTGVVKRWNGGTNGMADRIAQMNGNDPIIERLSVVEKVIPVANSLPATPVPKPKPKGNAPEITSTVVIIGAGGAATIKKATEQDSGWGSVIGFGFVTIAIAVVAVFVIHKIRNRQPKPAPMPPVALPVTQEPQ